MKKNILCIILLMSCLSLFAQQEPQYTHYAYNRLAYNPAVAGSMGNGVVGMLYRNQWSGVEGAPQSATVFGHLPLMNGRNGLGLTLTNDQLGMTKTTFSSLSYAYRIPLGNDNVLSLGLQGEVEYGSLDWSQTKANQMKDQLIGAESSTKIGANAGTGVYFKNRKFYVGLSAPRLFKNTLYRGIADQRRSTRDYRSYYFSGGATFDLSEKVAFVPMTMITFGPSFPTSVDLGANFLFMKKFGVGMNLRALDSFDALVQLQMSNRLKAGFSYDFTNSPLKKATSGSWEFLLEYQFKCNDKELINSIRYF
jgi:type IX secretion system PorP/SprF family membrane protein